jgi:hypothetical protein
MSDPAQLMDLFKVFDKDGISYFYALNYEIKSTLEFLGNGFITPTEIHEAMSNLGIELDESQVQQMIKGLF